MPVHEADTEKTVLDSRYRRAVIMTGSLLLVTLALLFLTGLSLINSREEMAELVFEVTARALYTEYDTAFLLRHGVLSTQAYSVSSGNPAPATIVAQATQRASVSDEHWTTVERQFGDGVPMMLVPPGCFYMGSGKGAADELPVNQVCFDAPYWIDKTEVTYFDFDRLGGSRSYAQLFPGDRHPVDTINWYEARNFCALRAEATNSDVRLPTEAEWEYASRGKNSLIYPWGDEWNGANAVWNENANGSAEVGSLPEGASWVGALDMSGNVWEWVSTSYGIDLNNDYVFTDDETLFSYPYSREDGRETINDDGTYLRVLRGGSLWNSAEYMRASVRYGMHPGLTNFNWGFRCARSDSPSASLD